jgi:hypothetical protein
MLIRAVFAFSILSIIISSTAIAQSPSDIVAKRRAMCAEKPYSSVVPRSNEPSGKLIVLRLCPDDPDMRIALGALQGIVNREKPVLYMGLDKTLHWFEYYQSKVVKQIVADPMKIFEMYKDQVKGMVVYDSSLDALANVAITYAGVEDLIPVTPEIAKTFSDKFGWKIVHDLRGKWKDRLEAYKWSYDNLFPKCTKFALMHYNHGYRGGDNGQEEPSIVLGYGVDYAVEFRMFVWHMTKNAGPEETKFGAKILESYPLYTPVFGRSSIMNMYDEPAFVSFVAKYSNLHIPFSAGNISVLSGARIPDSVMKQKPLPVHDFGPDKVYVAFTNSEHDNLEHVIGGGPPWLLTGFETDDPYRIWWCDPWRGKVPIGWPIGPLLSELAPTTLAQFATTATENDYFMAALSGLCLSDIPNFASAYPADQDMLLAGYAKLTSTYMDKLGWTMVNPGGPPGNLRTFAKNIPGLQGICEGYTMASGMTYDKANYTLDGVPVFHALTGGIAGEGRSEPISESYARRAKTIVNQIMAVKPNERPAFIHAWTIGWDYGPTILKMAADQLPKDYVVVRPDELASLFKKYKGEKAELKSVNPKVTPVGVVKETAGEDGLVIDTGVAKFEIGWGKTPQCAIKRVMGVDGKWRGTGHLIIYNPADLTAKSFEAVRTLNTDKEKDYLLSYVFSDGETTSVTIKAYAGRPYITMEELSSGPDMPSWSYDTFPDFMPDTMYTDSGPTNAVVSAGIDVKGGFPWHKWMLVGKKAGPDRDQIGIIIRSWADWNSGDAIYWCRPYEGYFEVYHQRKGTKKFAIAALDSADAGAAQRIWNELNGK